MIISTFQAFFKLRRMNRYHSNQLPGCALNPFFLCIPQAKARGFFLKTEGTFFSSSPSFGGI